MAPIHDQTLETIRRSRPYTDGIEWGNARVGHPEGAVREHIRQLEANLNTISDLVPNEYIGPLRLMIHTHDTFKVAAREIGPADGPTGHGTLAANYLLSIDPELDPDIAKIVQYHDTPYGCWCAHAYRGTDSSERFKKALAQINDHDLFATFLLLDGMTEGKHSAPLRWELKQIREHRELAPMIDAIFERLLPMTRDQHEQKNEIVPFHSAKEFSGITYRALGPVESWGADIHFALSDVPKLRPIVQALANRTGLRFAGVITTTGDTASFHLTRYPRRAELAVPSLEVYRRGYAELVDALKAGDVEVRGHSEEKPTTIGGVLRATIGLVEGYAETKKSALVKLIREGSITSREQALEMVSSQLGSLASFGIDPHSAPTLADVAEVLASKSLSQTHTVDEVARGLRASTEIHPGQILSAAPNQYLYEEPCVVLIGRGSEARKDMFNVARKFAQARFTCESLTARETVNVELPEFCGELAAK